PALVRGQPQRERQRLLREERVGGQNLGLPDEVAAPVSECHPPCTDVAVHAAALAEDIVLDLKNVGEVGVEEQRQLHRHRVDGVVGQLQTLLHAVAHVTATQQ